MFRNHRRQRRWAAQMLFLWLFGLVSGVANACLIPAAQATVRSAAQAASVAHPGQVTAAAPAAWVAHHPVAALEPSAGDPSASMANCVDFCDKAGNSIAPLKSTLDDGQARALAPPTMPVILPGPAFVPDLSRTPCRTAVAGLPIPIAFLRLTL